ncbi:MAG: zinc ribbon domain-containing protein [Sedimentisphaerales bacterium]
MKNFQLRFKFVLVLTVVVFSTLLCTGWSAKRNVNLNDFLKELSVTNVKDNQTQSTVWIPLEFYSRLLGSDPKTRKDFSALKPYLIFIVRCYDGNSYASWSQIQSRASLQGVSSAPVKPLTLVPSKINPMLDAIKTAVVSDSSIADMHFVVFDTNDSNGTPLVDTTIKDRIVLTLDASGSFAKTQFIWHTPFDAIIDAGTCPNCGDKVKPYWRFCPWCGSKL